MAPADADSRAVKKARKMKDPVQALNCLPPTEKQHLTSGSTITFETAWATAISDADHEWIFDLFRRNMRKLYEQSEWGYDEVSKKQELTATTARFIIARDQKGQPLGYVHYRFDLDQGRRVVYCYELQIEPTFQGLGAGTHFIKALEEVARKTDMLYVMATVFKHNTKSLDFFHKHGYVTDEMYRQEEDEVDYVILSKPI
ncbi:unnamed protein product, partial [Mesorhabditis spiculigera]